MSETKRDTRARLQCRTYQVGVARRTTKTVHKTKEVKSVGEGSGRTVEFGDDEGVTGSACRLRFSATGA